MYIIWKAVVKLVIEYIECDKNLLSFILSTVARLYQVTWNQSSLCVTVLRTVGSDDKDPWSFCQTYIHTCLRGHTISGAFYWQTNLPSPPKCHGNESPLPTLNDIQGAVKKFFVRSQKTIYKVLCEIIPTMKHVENQGVTKIFVNRYIHQHKRSRLYKRMPTRLLRR